MHVWKTRMHFSRWPTARFLTGRCGLVPFDLNMPGASGSLYGEGLGRRGDPSLDSGHMRTSGGSRGTLPVRAPYGPTLFQFHAVFPETLVKIICWCPPLEGWRPLLGKSWIHPWGPIWTHRPNWKHHLPVKKELIIGITLRHCFTCWLMSTGPPTLNEPTRKGFHTGDSSWRETCGRSAVDYSSPCQ